MGLFCPIGALVTALLPYPWCLGQVPYKIIIQIQKIKLVEIE